MDENIAEKLRIGSEKSKDLVQALENKIQSYEKIISRFDQSKKDLKNNLNKLQSEERDSISAKIPEIESCIKSYEFEKASLDLNEFDSELSEAIRRHDDLHAAIERRRRILEERVEQFIAWFPSAKKVATDLSELEYDDPDSLKSALSSIDEMEKQIDIFAETPPNLRIELSQKHGELINGIWSTITFSITNESIHPIEVIAMQLPNEIALRGGTFPIRVSSLETISQDIGVCIPFTGTLPIDIQALVKAPWDGEERRIKSTSIISVRESIETVKSEESTTVTKSIRDVSASSPNCSQCGRSLKMEWKKCPLCGTPTQGLSSRPSLCLSCGKPVKENWKKCPYCATNL